MSKSKRKKYYAVHFINTDENKIYKDWSKAQKEMKGHNNMFKGFFTEEECQEWFDSLTPSKIKKHNERAKKQMEEKRIEKSLTIKFQLEEEDMEQLKKRAEHYKVSVETYVKGLIQEDIWQ